MQKLCNNQRCQHTQPPTHMALDGKNWIHFCAVQATHVRDLTSLMRGMSSMLLKDPVVTRRLRWESMWSSHWVSTWHSSYPKCSIASEPPEFQTLTHDILFKLCKKVSKGDKDELIHMGRWAWRNDPLKWGWDQRRSEASHDVSASPAFTLVPYNFNRFWRALEQIGIRRSDPRLEGMVKNLEDIKREEFKTTPLENLELDKICFRR